MFPYSLPILHISGSLDVAGGMLRPSGLDLDQNHRFFKAFFYSKSHKMMKCYQTTVTLSPKSRGFHLVTREILGQASGISDIQKGVAHFFIQHTSAGLSINENADPSVRRDFESHFNRMVPEDTSLFEHTLEGPDDMTSHIKSSILGHAVSIPITGGRLNLGTWQGIYLCEHRNRGGRRKILVTAMGI